MSVSGLENSNLQVKKPELIKFEVSKRQLIGEPWPSSQGGRFQNILFLLLQKTVNVMKLRLEI